MARAERMAAEAEAGAAAASHRKITDALEAVRASASSLAAPESKMPSNSRPASVRRRLLAASALALAAGIGVGTWLGKVPRASWGLSPGQDALRLRLDDTLTSTAASGQRAVPRDRSASR